MQLLNACVVAFAAVFALLSFLAAVMHGITLAFPQRRATSPDPTLAAAISAAVAAVIPGARVTRIEEER